ncbi:MAG: helix-turn-helix domain-containing protein [Spirochaetales bacterium]
MLDLSLVTGERDYRALLDLPGFRQRLLIFREGSVTLSRQGAISIRGPAVVNHSPLAGLALEGANFRAAWVLSFDGVALDQLVASAFLLLCPMTGVFHMSLSEKEFDTLASILALMDDPSLGADILQVQAQLLVKYLAKFHTDDNSQRFAENDLVKRYVARVDRDHGDHHEVAHYAAQLGVSTRTLNRVFQEHTGITPKASLNYRLNLAAKSRLQERRASVKEIGYQLGFSSTTYFHEFFRKSNGLTPGEYARLSG